MNRLKMFLTCLMLGTAFHSVLSRNVRHPGITQHIVRIRVDSVCMLKEVRVKFTGNKAGYADMRIFGTEAYADFPFFRQDIISPVRIEKTRKGTQTVSYVFSTPIRITGKQFFIAFENLTKGVNIHYKSDRKTQAESQVLLGNEEFVVMSGSFEIEARLKTENDNKEPYTRNNIGGGSPAGNYAFVSDMNTDGYPDIMTANSLYLNSKGKFREVALPMQDTVTGVLPFSGDYLVLTSAKGSLCVSLWSYDGLSESFRPQSMPQHKSDSSTLIDYVFFEHEGSPLLGLLYSHAGKEGVAIDLLALAKGAPPAMIFTREYADSFDDLDVYMARDRSILYGRNDTSASGVAVYGPAGSGLDKYSVSLKEYSSDGRLVKLKDAGKPHAGFKLMESYYSNHNGAAALDSLFSARFRMESSFLAEFDYDADGMTDYLVSPVSRQKSTEVLMGKEGRYENLMLSEISSNIRDNVLIADLDADGRIDLLTKDGSGITAYLNVSAGEGKYEKVILPEDGAKAVEVAITSDRDRILHRKNRGNRMYVESPVVYINDPADTTIYKYEAGSREKYLKVDHKNGRAYFTEAPDQATGSPFDETGTGPLLWPNPFKDELNVNFAGFDCRGAFKLSVLDAKGQQVRFEGGECTGGLRIDMSTLPNGFYTLVLESENITSTHKIIKQK